MRYKSTPLASLDATRAVTRVYWVDVGESGPVLSTGSKEKHRMRPVESGISQVSSRSAGFLAVALGT
jgi:hypothetical protein